LFGVEPPVQQTPLELIWIGEQASGGRLHLPVFRSGSEPAGQHRPLELNTDPGAQHCVLGHAIPMQRLWH
jgi:hypothetical protein